MTDNYKKQLLDYITGDLTIESGVNEPSIVENNMTTTNYQEELSKILSDEQYQSEYFETLGYLSFTNTDKKIIYGNIKKYDWPNDIRGLMIIVDSKMNFLGYIDSYASGTQFSKFELLKVDEDNLIYGVDNVGEDGANKYRFIMLNDIISTYLLDETYVCELRKSYNFPSSYNTVSFYGYDYGERSPMSNKNKLYKEYEGSSYCFIGNSSNNYPTVITLKVNVGESNEWEQYTSNYGINYNKGIASYCVWQNDTINLTIGCISAGGNNYFEFSFNGSSLTRTKNIVCNNIKAIEMQSLNNIYIIQQYHESQSQGGVVSIFLVINYFKIDGTTLDSIYSYREQVQDIPLVNFYCYSINGVSFIIKQDVISNMTCSAIINDEVYVCETTHDLLYGDTIFVDNHYNLYSVSFTKADSNSSIETEYVLNFTMDYNPNNYNGQSYSDYNSLISNKGTLYNNQNLIFSRNLYNKTLLNNSTISTVEIPNTMLNNIEISEKELVSQTNMNMVDNLNSFTKNIYETVFVNYINILNVINEDTNTQYPVVASYINENINTGTQSNYEDTQCNKYRINYADSTTDIQTFSWASLDEFNSKMSITLTVDKAITSIDLLSNDETTVYLNIPLEGEVGNTYTISQKIRTGEKVQPVQLYYNNEEIMYNNQNVMVFIKE